jgi:hypothetical protein
MWLYKFDSVAELQVERMQSASLVHISSDDSFEHYASLVHICSDDTVSSIMLDWYTSVVMTQVRALC